MTDLWPIGSLLLAAVSSALLAVEAVRSPRPRLIRPNYRGTPVPAVLGFCLVAAASITALALQQFGVRLLRVNLILIVIGALVLGLVGFLDDAVTHSTRGLRAHLASLARGRPTTGILKLLAASLLAIVFATRLGGGPLRITAVAVLAATCTNVWNALDVRPGRAVKWGIVVLLAIVGAGWETDVALVAGAFGGAAVGVLPFDLTERGMLGDAGSNPLGFVVGASLGLVLPTWAVVAAAALALGLQLAAETVTISRLIEAVPPLRWFDRLGRRG